MRGLGIEFRSSGFVGQALGRLRHLSGPSLLSLPLPAAASALLGWVKRQQDNPPSSTSQLGAESQSRPAGRRDVWASVWERVASQLGKERMQWSPSVCQYRAYVCVKRTG